MDDDDECIHGLGPKAACTICSGKESKGKPETEWRFFAARYPGTCSGCHLPIYEGQLIAWAGTGHPVFHQGCEQ